METEYHGNWMLKSAALFGIHITTKFQENPTNESGAIKETYFEVQHRSNCLEVVEMS